MILWFMSAAWADPTPIVAIDDALGAAATTPPAAAGAIVAAAPAPAGWVAAVADCLDERAPGRFRVAEVAPVGEVDHAPVTLLGIGDSRLATAQPDRRAFVADLTARVTALRAAGTEVVLVGLVPPNPDQITAAPVRDAVVAEAPHWNAAIADLARRTGGVRHVDLWSHWPTDPAERARMTVDGWSLSDQGHARVAAAVCDEVLAWERGRDDEPTR